MNVPRFHKLAIADLRRETSSAVSVAFTVPPDLAEAYAFEPGQYLTLRASIDGEDARRTYSICSGLDDGELRVAIKEVDGGLFSSYANLALKKGDKVDVMTPIGRFTVPLEPQSPRIYLGIACGSGITPVMSHIRTVLGREPLSRFVLIYGNRSSRDIIFKDALEDLKDRHLGRLTLHNVLTREAQDIALLNGRLDEEKIEKLVRVSLPTQSIDHAFLCGPHGAVDAARAALAKIGVPAEHVHVELFTPSLPSDARSAARMQRASRNGEAPATIATATVRLDGATHRFPVAPGEGVIDAGLRAGLELPFSCKGGMCCTCRAKLVSGTVEMVQNYSLEPWEMEKGFVLACQSRPTSGEVTLDFDEA